jgi:hypothetical protein
MGIQRKEAVFPCTFVGRLGQFLLGRPKALVLFLGILWIFKLSFFLWEPEALQVPAVINSAGRFSWADAFGTFMEGVSVVLLRNYDRNVRKKVRCKAYIEISLTFNWSNEGSQWMQLRKEAGGSEVSAFSEGVSSARNPFSSVLRGRKQNLRLSVLRNKQLLECSATWGTLRSNQYDTWQFI